MFRKFGFKIFGTKNSGPDRVNLTIIIRIVREILGVRVKNLKGGNSLSLIDMNFA